MASIRLTDEQEKEIKKYHISRSEFVRRAVDTYLLHMKDPYMNILLLELEEWIQLKKNTLVTQMNTTVTQMNTTVPNENTKQNEHNTNNTTVTQQTTDDNLKRVLQKECQMLQRLLINPENCETIPDDTLKMLSKRYSISKKTIEAWVVENKQWLKETDFTQIMYDE